MDIQSCLLSIFLTFESVDIVYIVILLSMLILSAFFSMSETAFSSTNDAKLAVLVEERKAGAKKALNLANRFDKTLITLLIGNNIVNVAMSTVAVLFFARLLSNASESIVSTVSTIVVTLVLLIFGEIMPKVIAKKHSEAIALKVAWPIYILMLILTPLVYFFLGIQKMFAKNDDGDTESTTEDELNIIIDRMEDTGELEHDEAEAINRVLELNDRTVEDIMVPRIQMDAISYNSTLEQVKQFMLENAYSRIPVYKTDKDHIVGILLERDFFPAYVKNPKLSWRKLLRPVKFVAGSMKVDALIDDLQKSKTHIAIVSGEYGDVLGMVTMEDALEEIVGEIYDEHDTPGDNDLEYVENEDGSIIVDGEYFVEDLFERLNIGDIPEDIPSKLSGWMFAKCESLPEVGFSFDYIALYTKINDENEEYEDFAKVLTFEVNKVFNRRILNVKLTIRDATEEEIDIKKDMEEEED